MKELFESVWNMPKDELFNHLIAILVSSIIIMFLFWLVVAKIKNDDRS